MNLSKLTLSEAKMATSHWPLLLIGANNAGKTYALEKMEAEDKARTVVFNFDLKPVGSGAESEFHTTYTVSSSSETLDAQIALFNTKGKELKEQDPKHPALPRLREQVAHLKQIKKTSYFIDDIEAIDKMVADMCTITFDPEVDRAVADTVTALTEFCEAWADFHHAGREVWAAYGVAHQKIMQALKEINVFGCKYVYMLAHHDYIAPAQYATTPKEAVKVKGGIMAGNIERHFTTVVFAHVSAEGERLFECSNENLLDTSRTKLVDSHFSFVRESFDDLEQLLSGNKKILDGKVVDLDTPEASKDK